MKPVFKLPRSQGVYVDKLLVSHLVNRNHRFSKAVGRVWTTEGTCQLITDAVNLQGIGMLRYLQLRGKKTNAILNRVTENRTCSLAREIIIKLCYDSSLHVS